MGIAILGHAAITLARWLRRPLKLYETERQWFRAWADTGAIPGACVVDWQQPVEIRDALAGLTAIRCQTAELAARLQMAFDEAAWLAQPRLESPARWERCEYISQYIGPTWGWVLVS